MKLSLRSNGTNIQQFINAAAPTGAGSSAATVGQATGAAIGTAIAPGVGTAIGTSIGNLVGRLWDSEKMNRHNRGVNQIIEETRTMIGKELKALTDTEAIAWGYALNSEKKSIPARVSAGEVPATVGARYVDAYSKMVNEIKNEMLNRGYKKGGGIPEGRDPNTMTGYDVVTPTTTAKAPGVNMASISNIATIGLIVGLGYMLFKGK